MDEHERAALVQRRLTCAFSRRERRTPRGAGRRLERGQLAAIAVGPSLHQYRGCTRGNGDEQRQHHRLLLAGKSAAHAWTLDAVGIEGTCDAMVYRWAGRGGIGRRTGG